MRILILSDIHTEFWHYASPPMPELPDRSTYDVVVAAGDIGVGTVGPNWLRWKFPDDKIIYITGNHEYYGQDYLNLKTELMMACADKEIMFLDPGQVQIDGYTFVGGNLWTDFALKGYQRMQPRDLRGLADFERIFYQGRKLTMYEMMEFHEQESLHLCTILNEQRDSSKTIVITHFMPSQLCIDERYIGNASNPYFTNDLDGWFDTYKYPLHIYGHTHTRGDIVHPYGTRLVANPFGYPNENKEPYEWKIVEV